MGFPNNGVPGPMFFRISPPRMPKTYIERNTENVSVQDHGLRAAVIQAPAGFGKTFLLSQWRRKFLERGCVAPWLAIQLGDDARQLLHALTYGVRLAAARPTFGHTLLHGSSADVLGHATTFLSEITYFGLPTVVFLDDVDRLSADGREIVSYLVRNAPANLQVILTARSECELGLQELVAYGGCQVIGASALRFNLEETLDLVALRLGKGIDRDVVARLHQVIEGWPLGLQLTLAMVGRSPHPLKSLQKLLAQGLAHESDLVGHLLSQLAPSDVSWLTLVSCLDHLYPDLCKVVTNVPTIAQHLERLAAESTALVQVEGGECYRLHNLARQSLAERFVTLPKEEQLQVHARAARWFMGHGQLDMAALHALKAGDSALAYDLAERSLYESLMMRGQQTQVVDWRERLPKEVIDDRPQLGLAVAWSLALSERHEEAQKVVNRLLSLPAVNDELRCECALILSGAAIYADDPDRFMALHQPWAENPPLTQPALQHIHLNRSAYITLIQGNPSLARLKLQQGPSIAPNTMQGYLGQWGELVLGLTYLWEGQVLLAEKMLQPTLALADQDHGRRSPFSCMLASFLAASLWEQNRPVDAVTLLADRLDVLERHGMPEAVLLAYRTLSRSAMHEGQEHRAIELLEAMYALGVSRGMPRLCLASLTEQIRMHARRYRTETCKQLYVEASALVVAESAHHGDLWQKSAESLLRLAQGYSALAGRRWREANDALTLALGEASRLKMGRLKIEILGLRAFALDQLGEQAQAMFQEAMDLAQTYGLTRVFADAHPDLGEWVKRMKLPGTEPQLQRSTAPTSVATVPKAPSSVALTPKEREVIELLGRNLSNKEIGLALAVGEETVKWHMKNLFTKLDAGTRKQVLARARLFGLVSG